MGKRCVPTPDDTTQERRKMTIPTTTYSYTLEKEESFLFY